MPLWLPHLLQAGSLIVVCIFAALLALLSSGILHRALERMPVLYLAPQETYQRYMRGRNGLALTLTTLAALAPFFVALVAFVIDAALSPSGVFPDAGITQIGYSLLWGFALSLTVAPLVFNIISAQRADAQAMRELLGLTTQPGDLITLRARVALLSTLPLILLIESFFLLSALAQNGLLPTIIGGALVAALVAWLIVVSFSQVTLFFTSVPIEQTQWGEFGARARDWARLAGIRLEAVRVLPMAALGSADGYIRGFGARTIYVSDVFLQMSEWRQQDAYTAYLLGYSQRRRKQAPWTYGASALLLLFFVSVAFLPILLPGIEYTSSGDPIFLYFTFVLLLLLIILSISRQRGRNILFTSDAYAAQLTGDPTAVMAMVATIDSRSGGFARTAYFRGVVSPLLRYGGYRGAYGFYSFGSISQLPTILNRLAALDAIMRTPGPRAPWAMAPVPSITPVAMGPYPVTVPLQQAAQAAPGPVPVAPYPTYGVPYAPPVSYAPAAPYAPMGYAPVPQPPHSPQA